MPTNSEGDIYCTDRPWRLDILIYQGGGTMRWGLEGGGGLSLSQCGPEVPRRHTAPPPGAHITDLEFILGGSRSKHFDSVRICQWNNYKSSEANCILSAGQQGATLLFKRKSICVEVYEKMPLLLSWFITPGNIGHMTLWSQSVVPNLLRVNDVSFRVKQTIKASVLQGGAAVTWSLPL